MNISFRKGVFLLAMAGLSVLTSIANAQNQPPSPPSPPPPVSVEAPDQPANATPPAPPVEAPANPAPNVEAPADAGAPAADQSDQSGSRTRHGRHRRNSAERVQVGGDVTVGPGEHADDVVSVFGNSTSSGEVGDVVSVFGDTRVLAGSAHDVVAVAGNVYLNTKAAGDVVASFGNVELGPQAEVEGDVVVVGGKLERDPAAIVRGNVQNVFAFAAGSFEWLRPWARHCLLLGRPLALAPGLGWAWGLALGFLALYVLIAFLFRDAVDRTVRTFETQPGRCIIAALLTTVLTPVVFALLLVTVVGIPFMPFAALGLFVLGIFGKAVALAWIGRSCLRLGGEARGAHTAVAVALGGAIILVFYLVPFIGFIVYKLLGILGLGIAVYALIQTTQERRSGGGGPEPALAGGPAGGAGAAFKEPTIGENGPSSTSARSSWDFGAGPSSSARSAFDAGAPRASEAPGASEAQGTSGAKSEGVHGTSQASDVGGTSRPADAPNASDSSTRATPPPPPPPPNPPTDTVALTYPRAGFGIRMAALFIDLILVAVVLNIIDSKLQAELIALAAYGAVMWKLKSTTIGGIVFGLQVVRLDGRPIDWATATVRALSCFLSLLVAGLGFIWIAFDGGNQAWHDKIAGTVVVRVPKGVSLL
ncbi:MAG TPA: RDD family protein [Steroidobacteraceae bacterium]|nr:RDD family protein [Steroidobacteraceae bacterium]